MTITPVNIEPGFDATVIGMVTTGGRVYLDDVIDLTTPKGRKIKGARIVRIDGWSTVPFKVEYLADDGKLRKDAFNLSECSWCHSGGTLSKRTH